MLRDHVMDQRPPCHHAGARLDGGHDPGNPFVRLRRQGQNGFALWVQRGAFQKIHLTPHARVDLGADAVADHLSRDVDLYAGIDRGHFGLL